MGDHATTTRPRTFSAIETARLAGCTYRQLDYWTRVGYVEPNVGARGSGSRRRFTGRDVAVVRAVTKLRDMGVVGTTLARAAATLADESKPWNGSVLVTLDGDVLDLLEVILDGGARLPAGYCVTLESEHELDLSLIENGVSPRTVGVRR